MLSVHEPADTANNHRDGRVAPDDQLDLAATIAGLRGQADPAAYMRWLRFARPAARVPDTAAADAIPDIRPPQRSGRAGPGGQEARVAAGYPSLSPNPPSSPTPAGLVVTGQNSACKESLGSVADILGMRFPGPAEVMDAAKLLGKAARESRLRSQIEVSPGSIRFRRTVPVDPDESAKAGEQNGAGRQAITGWTAKSRRQMLRSFAALDYGPMIAGDGIPVQVTLTYPADWLTVAPSRLAVQRHFRMLERRFVRAWGEPVICLWKLEYQHRGAPHFHLWMRRPSGLAGQARQARYEAERITWEAAGRIGPRPRYRRAYADGLRFQQWLSLTWAAIVAHPDPEQRAAHERAGTQVSVKEGLRGLDPKRASVYFSKHGFVKGEKEYQNKPPDAWLEAGEGPGRYWGYLGLSPVIAAVQVDGGRDYKVAKRTMRRWSARSRLAGGDYAKATRKVRVKRGTRWRTVTRPVGRLGGQSGTLCVNDGPKMAEYLARVIQLTAEQDKGIVWRRWHLDEAARRQAITAARRRKRQSACDVPDCGQTGRLYPSGVRCEMHKPQRVLP